jgi:hypothetical protein
VCGIVRRAVVHLTVMLVALRLPVELLGRTVAHNVRAASTVGG